MVNYFYLFSQCLLLYVLYPNVAPACFICILPLSAKHTLRRQYLLNRLQLNHHLKIQIGLVFQLLLWPLFLFLTYFLNLTNHHLSFLTCRLFCSSLSFFFFHLCQLFSSLLFVFSIAFSFLSVLLSCLSAYLSYLHLSFSLSFGLLSGWYLHRFWWILLTRGE